MAHTQKRRGFFFIKKPRRGFVDFAKTLVAVILAVL